MAELTLERDAPRLRDQHDYLRLLAARIAGTAAQQMLMVALGWQVYELTSSAWALGFVGLAQFLPALLLTLPAGHLVDRHDRRLMLAASALPLPLSEAHRQLLEKAEALGYGEADNSAIIKAILEP